MHFRIFSDHQIIPTKCVMVRHQKELWSTYRSKMRLWSFAWSSSQIQDSFLWRDNVLENFALTQLYYSFGIDLITIHIFLVVDTGLNFQKIIENIAHKTIPATAEFKVFQTLFPKKIPESRKLYKIGPSSTNHSKDNRLKFCMDLSKIENSVLWRHDDITKCWNILVKITHLCVDIHIITWIRDWSYLDT